MLRTVNNYDDPILSLQSDWDDLIQLNNKEIWISATFKGKKGIHSKIVSQGMNLPICVSNDFSILFCSKTKIEIKYNPTGHVFIFIAPVKTLVNIHKDKISSLDISPKGWGISVSVENDLVLWNSTSGEILKILKGHVGDVYKCKYFPSGVVILSAGADMQLKIWCAESGICPVTLIGHKAAITDFSIVDRGRNVISVSKDGCAKLWDCGKSECITTIFKSDNILNCCALGVLKNSENLLPFESANDREIGTNGKLLIIGSEEGFVFGIDISRRKKLFTINVNAPVNLVLMLSGVVVVGCQNGEVKLFQLSEIEVPFKVFSNSNSPALCGCSLNNDGFLIGRNDGSVMYYNHLNCSYKTISLTGANFDPIYDMCYTNNVIYTCCRDGKIRKYTIENLITNEI